MTHRVVVTGMAGITPLGCSWDKVKENIVNKKTGVVIYDELSNYSKMRTRLAAPCTEFETPLDFPRKKKRTMGRVSQMAVKATSMALRQAELLNSPLIKSTKTGVSYGSTTGSPPDFMEFARQIDIEKTLEKIKGSLFIKFMSHTCAANIGNFFETKGRIIPTTTACTSGSQGIGFAYESIKYGLQDIMLAGGAEELHPMHVAVFDVMFATSVKNEEPIKTPSPFDRDRDGLVVGEGAATLILESYESAKKRGVKILGEIVGYATTSDGAHMVNPSTDGMRRVMQEALGNAGLESSRIDYVNAHGTATEIGDVAETNATEQCFGSKTPFSSLKSYMGHTLGACGAIEAWICLKLLDEGWIPPNINLENIDEKCGKLDYVTDVRKIEMEYIMSNNFAFGGVNTSLVFRKFL